MVQDKRFISADGLLADSIRLARQIHDAGFRPTHIVAVWRGGAPVGIAVQEYLEYRGLETHHIAVRTASYTGIDRQAPVVRVFGEGYLVDTLNAEDRLLIASMTCSTAAARSRPCSVCCRRNAAATIPAR
ncbi:hypothetical protein GCM10017621_08940 [Maricaulis virginensis]|uniref:Hypoxanthine phosphoribosyltransferase n=1 Tax=Maricaulis virginensis TaxID=144022 RepID=A0A9W6MMZ9_9PROT|nr:hypothetical protein [Maricaulis virginensis]GLK51386.1 hypothetical protein GCM10017621_08940 [Maricaulis virginensis]